MKCCVHPSLTEDTLELCPCPARSHLANQPYCEITEKMPIVKISNLVLVVLNIARVAISQNFGWRIHSLTLYQLKGMDI